MSTQNEPTIEDLIAFGYAPGNYMGKCRDCGKTEWGRDKRAWRCKGCATERWREKQEAKDNMSTQEEQQPLVDRLREGVIWTYEDCPPEDDVVDNVATNKLLREAADEIERLRKIFEEVMEMGRDGGYDYCWRDVYDAAKEALSPYQ